MTSLDLAVLTYVAIGVCVGIGTSKYISSSVRWRDGTPEHRTCQIIGGVRV